MHPSIYHFFEHTRSKVTAQDIIDHAPNDPGYPDYVRVWTGILKTGIMPKENHFDLSEVISLTGFGSEEAANRGNGRYRVFRRFTSSVALGLIHSGHASHFEEPRPPNYIARDLIVDLDRGDAYHLNLLRDVFPTTREVLLTSHNPQFPYFTFGTLILAQIAEDWTTAESAADQLIQDDHTVRTTDSMNRYISDVTFLLGLDCFDRYQQDWIAHAASLKNPNHHPSIELIKDAIDGSRKNTSLKPITSEPPTL